MPHLDLESRLIVITGHYGCGKTNFSINLALDLARDGDPVTLVDLDIVNPYFRSSDYSALLAHHGVRVIAPSFAGTTLDTPVLSADIHSVFDGAGRVIFDVGGDDVGATAIGQHSGRIKAAGYEMLYVVNRYRNLTGTPGEAAELLAEIESASRLKATAIVNNSHLGGETTMQHVLDSIQYAREVADILGLPIACTTVPRDLATAVASAARPAYAIELESAYPIDVYVRPPWELDSSG